MLHPNCVVNYFVTPDRIKKLIEKDFNEWKSYVPHWVMELNITYEPVDTDRPITAACTEVEFGYWKANLTVYDRYFVKTEEERKLYFLHEMLHVHMGPLHNYLWQIEQKEGVPQEMIDLGAQSEENVVESITFMIKEIEAGCKPG